MTCAVAGIIDRQGGLRVVITEGSLLAHLLPGEKLYIAPFQVEAAPWGNIPSIVAEVERFIVQARR
jgi:hypothetical protein